jgi:hypothetical protein
MGHAAEAVAAMEKKGGRRERDFRPRGSCDARLSIEGWEKKVMWTHPLPGFFEAHLGM